MCAVCIVQVRKQDFHRVVEPQKIQTGREFVSSCSQQGQLWVQTWLLRALSQWMLKISKTAAFLGSLTHCWTVLKVKKFLFESNMNVSWPSLWPLSLFLPPHIWERSGSTSSIISLKVFGKLLLKPSLLQVLSLSLITQGKFSHCLYSVDTLLNTLQFVDVFLLIRGQKLNKVWWIWPSE